MFICNYEWERVLVLVGIGLLWNIIEEEEEEELKMAREVWVQGGERT